MRKCFKTILYPGQRFGSWTVLSEDEEESRKRKYTMYLCKCDCGTIQSIRASRLTNGYTTNCSKCGNIKMSITKRGKNQYDLSGDYGIGWTTNTNKQFYFDKEQYEKIKIYTWYENTTTGYVTTQSYNKCIDLHRYILDAKPDEIVDHIHGKNTILDNRKCNLRIVTKQQNNINRGIQSNNKSGTTGVRWREDLQKWESRIGYNRKTIMIGIFDNYIDAVKARKQKENELFKEYSYDNSQLINKEEIKYGMATTNGQSD